MQSENEQWAEEEFGAAVLGNARRTRRLVQVAAGAAASPGAHITAVFREGSEREGAFRLIENDAVEVAQVARAAHDACALRGAEYSFAFVPVDGTSLNLADWQRTKGLGVIGSRWIGARGLQVLSAIGVAPDSTPLGMCGQMFWARKRRSRRRGRKDARLLESKETMHWLTVMQEAEDAFYRQSPSTKPWFQLDRGGDAWPVLLHAVDNDRWITVRANHDRRLWREQGEPRRYLWSEVQAHAPIAHMDLDIPEGPYRRARRARMVVRACEVTLDLHNMGDRWNQPARLWAVHTKEVGTPHGERPIEWMLLTTHPADTPDRAFMVIHGYSKRWVIEEFHRVWKSGACRVEETQLRACDHITRWATILASIAMRILRLKNLARTSPLSPATDELSQAEIDAILVVTKKTPYRPGEVPTIAEAVDWLAKIGGYTGKSSGGPPGPTVIARGLERIQLLAEHLANQEKK